MREYFKDLAYRTEVIGIRAEYESGLDRFFGSIVEERGEGEPDIYGPTWPLPFPNVWLGVSVEDQQRADERIPHLLQTPAAVRFLSVEPMLGPVDLMQAYFTDGPGIDWAIVGGESGPGARPCRTEWIQSIVDQCAAAGVRCFVKQLGAHVIQGGERRKKADKKGGDMDEWPHALRIRQMPGVSL